MTRWPLLTDRRQRRRAGWLAAALVLAVGWLIYHSGGYRYTLSDKERATVEQLTEQPQTRYFGYYAIDLPAEFIPVGMIMYVHGTEMTRVDTKKQYYFPFKQFLERYEEELKNTLVSDPLDAPYLKNIYILNGGKGGIIFERIPDEYTPDAARILDAWKWADNITLSVEMKARDGRNTRYDSRRKISSYSFGYTVPEQKARLTELMAGLTAREDTRPPSPGKLAVHLAEVDAGLLGKYEVNTSYSHSHHGRNIGITFRTDNSSYTEVPLLKRNSRLIEGENGTTLFKGRRKVGGLDISEWAVSTRTMVTAEPTLVYKFWLTANEERQGGHMPLRFTMAYKVDLLNPEGMLTEHELVALWQSITETLKYQPRILK